MSTTLSLACLSADLLRIHAHGLAETNVISVQHTAGGAIYIETDTSELEAQLAHSNAMLAQERMRWLEVRNSRDEILIESLKMRAALEPFAALLNAPLDSVGGGTLFAPSIKVQLIKDAQAALLP